MQLQTYSHAYNLGHVTARSLDNGLDVLAALCRLRLDVTLDHLAAGVHGDLTGQPNLTVGLDGLRVWRRSYIIEHMCWPTWKLLTRWTGRGRDFLNARHWCGGDGESADSGGQSDGYWSDCLTVCKFENRSDPD